ncbi:hypothetical protein ACFSQ7_49265 [Paenibacillus rhizoplanae]
MLVQAFYGFNREEELDEISVELRYRASQLDGLTIDGKPFTSASDPEYIEQYTREHCYSRWGAGHLLYDERADLLLPEPGEARYCHGAGQPDVRRVLLWTAAEYFFHKIVLLKLANLHSRLRINHDYDEIENLIFLINKFFRQILFFWS